MSRLHEALTALERKPHGIATGRAPRVGMTPAPIRYRWPTVALGVGMLSAAVALMLLPHVRSTALSSPVPAVPSAPRPEDVRAPDLRQRAREAAIFGALEEAETLLQLAVTRAPADAVSWNDLGVVLVRRGEPGRGIDAFKRSVALDSKYAPAHRNLAVALETDGRAPEAMPHYRAFLALAPNDQDRERVAQRLAGSR